MFNEIKIPYNPGILSFDLPDVVFEPFKQKVLENMPTSGAVSIEKQYNNSLVGQIEHEVLLECPANLKFFLLDAAAKYQNHFNINYGGPLMIETLWANFQKKHEYNPVHSHNGDVSFIIFIQIPYSLKDEDMLANTKKSLSHANGRLSFIYQTLFDGPQNLKLGIDDTFVGKMLMFPNTALHAVYPFYTADDYRITVSGNIRKSRD